MKLVSVKAKSVKLPINLHFIQLKNDFNLEAFFDWTQYTFFEMALKCNYCPSFVEYFSMI